MDAPSLLVVVSLLLMALGGAALVMPGPGAWVAPIRAAVCALGVAASLWAGAWGGTAGLLATVDGLSRPLLLALFLLGATGWQTPAAIGAAALALLAADAPMLVLGTALAAAIAIATSPPTLPKPLAARLAVLAVLCLVAALLLQGRLDMQFTAMRGQSMDGLRGILLLASVLAAAALLAAAIPGALGGLLAVALLARLLLDLPGPGTPGWWGVPVLLAGAAAAAATAWRAATAPDLARAAAHAGRTATATAATGLGAALLARGTDLLPAAALGVGGALFTILAWSAWGGALHLATRTITLTAGGTELSRLGGLLPRAPWTALALATALASMAALPFSAGFASLWTVAQSVFGAARSGGQASVLIAAAAASALALATALGATAAFRLAAAVLPGQPRSAKAARLADPPPMPRAATLAYAALALLTGLVPGPILLFLEPGTQALAGAPADGMGLLTLAAVPDAPAYIPLILLAVILLALAAAALRGPVTRGGPPWTGGTLDPAPRDPTPAAPALPRPDLQAWQAAAPKLAIAALGMALALVIGWAAAR